MKGKEKVSTPQPTDPLGKIYASWIEELSKMPETSLQVLRWIFEDWHSATTEPEGVTYASTTIGGVPGILVTPLDCDPQQMIVFFHGGGFALGSSNSHRKMVGHLAKALKTQAFVLDFRLAPEDKFPAQIEDGVAVITALLKQGFKIEDITPAGDSAGGNLAIATTLQLMQDKKPVPAQVLTMSPWLNMENNGMTIETNDASDFLITREGLQGNIDRYIEGAVPPTNPLANPLYADFTDFPRLYICAADTESLFDDSVRLNELAKKAGVDVTFSIGKNQQHVYPFQAGRWASADEEIALMAQWYLAGRN